MLVHAAGESAARSAALPEGTYAIALHVRDEQHLRDVARFLTAAGVVHHLVIEDTDPFAGQAMAIGVTPSPREPLRRLFSSLPLVR
jgi:peptidyl-tRNA hydrolase